LARHVASLRAGCREPRMSRRRSPTLLTRLSQRGSMPSRSGTTRFLLSYRVSEKRSTQTRKPLPRVVQWTTREVRREERPVVLFQPEVRDVAALDEIFDLNKHLLSVHECPCLPSTKHQKSRTRHEHDDRNVLDEERHQSLAITRRTAGPLIQWVTRTEAASWVEKRNQVREYSSARKIKSYLTNAPPRNGR
jgi:hypothetical protein